jgi:hypothetical protein
MLLNAFYDVVVFTRFFRLPSGGIIGGARRRRAGHLVLQRYLSLRCLGLARLYRRPREVRHNLSLSDRWLWKPEFPALSIPSLSGAGWT